MCGIAGFWDSTHQSRADDAGAVLRRMTRAIRHRGPDDEGFFQDPAAGIALGHRRLSVIDLSPEGHQPMVSASGRFVIIYNGEIYNHRALRQELVKLGSAFRGHSDTEVILAAIEQWGLDQALKRFIGMFAFALWDRRERRLSLVRDRLGIKPLYYGWAGGTLLFASELKAFRAHPSFTPEVDRGALTLYLRHNYVPTPYSIYRGVSQLTPGCVLSVGPAAAEPGPPVPYWSAKEVAERGVAQ